MDFASLLHALVFGLPHAQPGGLVLTWLLFLSTIGLSIPLAYCLACLCHKLEFLDRVLSPSFVLLRGVPPLIIVFSVDHLLSLQSYLKGVLSLAVYSMSHLFPIFLKYINLYPEHLTWVETVHKIGRIRCYMRLWAWWVFSRSFPALQTHLVSLFKDTSIVIVIGMLELSAVTNLLATRAYQFSDWVSLFALCSALYFVNVQIANLLCRWIRNRAFYVEA